MAPRVPGSTVVKMRFLAVTKDRFGCVCVVRSCALAEASGIVVGDGLADEVWAFFLR